MNTSLKEVVDVVTKSGAFSDEEITKLKTTLDGHATNVKEALTSWIRAKVGEFLEALNKDGLSPPYDPKMSDGARNAATDIVIEIARQQVAQIEEIKELTEEDPHLPQTLTAQDAQRGTFREALKVLSSGTGELESVVADDVNKLYGAAKVNTLGDNRETDALQKFLQKIPHECSKRGMKTKCVLEKLGVAKITGTSGMKKKLTEFWGDLKKTHSFFHNFEPKIYDNARDAAMAALQIVIDIARQQAAQIRELKRLSEGDEYRVPAQTAHKSQRDTFVQALTVLSSFTDDEESNKLAEQVTAKVNELYAAVPAEKVGPSKVGETTELHDYLQGIVDNCSIPVKETKKKQKEEDCWNFLSRN